jgi:hypothetical protein
MCSCKAAFASAERAMCLEVGVVVREIERAGSSNGCDLRSARHPEMVVGREWIKRTGVGASG